MPDEIDATDEKMEVLAAAGIAAVRDEVARMPKGYPGECVHCEEHSLRLVRGACAPCRDRLGLP